MLNEHITKAQQAAAMLASDIRTAFHIANAIARPEGRSRSDRAITAYLAECLDAAKKLEQRLLELGD